MMKAKVKLELQSRKRMNDNEMRSQYLYKKLLAHRNGPKIQTIIDNNCNAKV